MAVGRNGYGELDVSSWTNIKAIAAGHVLTVGLKEDGTVVAGGNNWYGQLGCSSWTNIRPVCGQDTTPPITSADISGTAGNNGWFVTDAAISLTALDTDSSVKEIHYSIDGTEAIVSGGSTSFIISTDGEHSVSYYAIDDAANIETANSLTIKLDKTAPAVTASSTPGSNATGWNKSDVTISYACSDSTSGILSCQSPIAVVSEGAGQEILGTAEDFAGLKATAAAFVNLDKTAPVITASVDISPNAAGWHNSDVTATFICSDMLSGIASCPAPMSVTADGVGQVISGTAVDKAGNSAAATMTINMDKRLPLIAPAATPAPNANGWNNTNVTVAFMCSDALSGIASCTQPITASTEGAGQVITGAAADQAGNSAAASLSLNIDKTPPAVTISASTSKHRSSHHDKDSKKDHDSVDVVVNGTATDSGSGIASVVITVTDEQGAFVMTVPGFGSSINLETGKERGGRHDDHGEHHDKDGGSYTIAAVALDKAGNQSTATTTVSVSHDSGDSHGSHNDSHDER